MHHADQEPNREYLLWGPSGVTYADNEGKFDFYSHSKYITTLYVFQIL